jgi:uncharacterized protein YdaU (DUF1376 family)
MKDPAFLFYSKDFYEGTRTMLPKERACYIDLMIYQHQHGPIPNDMNRIAMYCSGIDEATLKATLEAKFKLTLNGWINERLENVISDRKKFSSKQSQNGKIGQFWKKSKSILSSSEYSQLRKAILDKDNSEILQLIKGKEISEATLKALLKHLVNENINVDVNDNDSLKEIVREKIDFSVLENIPWFESILRYLQLKITYDELMIFWKQFQDGMIADDNMYRDKEDYRSHFRNWVKIQIDNNEKNRKKQRNGFDSDITRLTIAAVENGFTD